MIASLGMYDFGAAQAANDRLWAGLRAGLAAGGIAAPAALTRGEGAYWPAWESPDLVLSQTCGFPYRARLHGRVELVGAPVLDLAGVAPGQYHSVVVVRAGDPREDLLAFSGAALAWNEDLSQSGWAALANWTPELGFRLNPVLRTGGHRASAAAVASGRAEIAALDALTFAMLEDAGDADTRALRVIAQTPPSPALPYIAARGADPAAIRAALAAAIDGLSPQDRATLRLKGVVAVAAEDYLAVPIPPSPGEFQCKT
ncbi:MAG: PhnD/SsuA/transferrin family substrate-binding protein [Rhodobacteraceae bacterium]|nr:PhnD/SsuA/transferrin family substrate-binding protein [Paracoccaceae bacterium]